jgi:hypothetical protein
MQTIKYPNESDELTSFCSLCIYECKKELNYQVLLPVNLLQQ